MTYLAIESDARRMTVDEIESLADGEIPEDSPLRIDVDLGFTIVPLLVVKRRQDRLVILNNGSVDLGRSGRVPVFQRSSWWSEISAHQIYVCDPGTVGDDATALNWLQSRGPTWIVRDLMKALLALSRVLGVTRPERRLYYGSSAGGFAALLELAYDRRARAVVNNPQINWTRWYAHQVSPVLQSHFPRLDAKTVRERFPQRASCLHSFTKMGGAANVDYWVNMASQHDREVQLPIVLKTLRDSPEICRTFSIHMYYDEQQGHSPLSKQKTLELLESH